MSVDNINATYGKPAELDEIVFEHRNKEYRAYDLRKKLQTYTDKIFTSRFSIISFAVLAPLVYLKLRKKDNKRRD